MKVLFAASEAAPFIRTGGLGDVAGALPKALLKNDVDCRVILPLYLEVSRELREQMTFMKVVWVPLAWRSQYCGIFQAKAGNITYYLLDNKFYFDRKGLYGFFDDAERFAFFSKAVLEVLPYLDFEPDVIHCNDWQTGLIPVFLEAYYRKLDFYRNIRTLYTIHNLEYQGIFGPEVIEDVLGMPKSSYEGGWLKYDNCVNLMKGAIVSAGWISTVSPTYAEEIQTKALGFRLEYILRNEKDKLTGILNGIDTDLYNPATDPRIAQNYDAKSLAGKAVCKRQLQKAVHLPERDDVVVIGMVSRFTWAKGFGMVREVLEDILSQDVQLVVIGTGDAQYEQMFKDAARRHPDRVSANIVFDVNLAQQVYAGADMFLMPSVSEPCGLSQMIAMRYGTVPIVRETGGLKDTVQALVNGYTFASTNAQDMRYVIFEAIDQYYRQPDIFLKYRQACMDGDYSWDASAKEYTRIYHLLHGDQP